MNVELRAVTVPLRGPFGAAHGPVTARELLLLALHDEPSGVTGWGEAAPLPSYDGVSGEEVRAALRDCVEPLRVAELGSAADPAARAALLAECAARARLPQALAAIDLALHDLAGRAAGRPVWSLVADSAGVPAPIAVNWTISAPDRAGAAREASFAREHGFTTVKLKVGTGDDAGRLAAVRAAGGPGLAIRLDANGAWRPVEAARWLEVLAPAGVELCEEPVAGVAAIESLAASAPVPVAIDESAADPAALARRRCRAICLKISRCGGIAGLLSDARRARALGYEVYLASTLDGPLGIAAALHAAAVVAPDRPCGLATLALFAERPDPLAPSGGAIPVPSAPGLGDGLEAWYA